MTVIPTTCQHCGTLFEARRQSAKFCSARCRAASSYHNPNRVSVNDLERAMEFDAPAVLNTLMEKMGLTARDEKDDRLRWEQVDEVTWKLTDGVTVHQGLRNETGWKATRALAYVEDKGHAYGLTSWHAVCGKRSIGPAKMEACGLADEAGLAEAKLVAMAMATGNVYELVLAARDTEDATEDMRLSLLGMLELISEAVNSEEAGT
ncbi:MAG: hypothetical protein ACK4F5_14965 [Aliihoeflea sp.]